MKTVQLTTAGDGLAGLLEQANGLEGAVSNFTTTNATYGTSYTESADIQGEIDDLTTLLNGDDSDNEADNITGFFDAHSDISDLADLHSQMATATVTLDISAAKDDRTHEVVLDVTEVGRLGEGRVDIAATQTDAAGNVHEGVAQTAQFTIDTVNPTVGITDDQDGL